MRISEKKFVEDPVMRYCKKRWPELEGKKMNGLGQKDWPDRMFNIPGGFPFYIEFKSPGEEPTPKQAYMIAKLKRQGYDVEVHDSKETAIAAITRRMCRDASPVCGPENYERALDTTRLPKESDQVPDRKDVGSTVPRPRTRKDKHHPSDVQALKEKRVRR